MRRFSPSLLRSAREKNNLSREETAVLIKRSYQSVFLYERGAVRPPTAVLERLAALYNCEVSDFFAESDPLEELIRG
jgi:transcriptional regulator with XRE-family HTH domain